MSHDAESIRIGLSSPSKPTYVLRYLRKRAVGHRDLEDTLSRLTGWVEITAVTSRAISDTAPNVVHCVFLSCLAYVTRTLQYAKEEYEECLTECYEDNERSWFVKFAKSEKRTLTAKSWEARMSNIWRKAREVGNKLLDSTTMLFLDDLQLSGAEMSLIQGMW